MKTKFLLAGSLAMACAFAPLAQAQSSFNLFDTNRSITGTTVDSTVVPSTASQNAVAADQQLMRDVVTQLVIDPGMAGARVNVEVDQGRVTLSGIVLDTPQQLRARSIADNVAGSANVTDRMTTGG